MKTFINGIQKIEIGVPGLNGALPAVWTTIQDISEGSVVHTTNKVTKTSIKAEDKYAAVLILYVPGDADSINFSLLQLSIDNAQKFIPCVYDPLTSKITVTSKRLPIPLAVRLTTQPQFGVIGQFTYRNTTATFGLKNNFTKNAVVELDISADILPWNMIDGTEVVWEEQILNADGTVIDGTLPTVNAGADAVLSEAVAAFAALVGTDAAAGTKTITSILWSVKSGPAGGVFATPNALASHFTPVAGAPGYGVYILTLTVQDSSGFTASDDVQITVTA